jgi:hypothetical protein
LRPGDDALPELLNDCELCTERLRVESPLDVTPLDDCERIDLLTDAPLFDEPLLPDALNDRVLPDEELPWDDSVREELPELLLDRLENEREEPPLLLLLEVWLPELDWLLFFPFCASALAASARATAPLRASRSHVCFWKWDVNMISCLPRASPADGGAREYVICLYASSALAARNARARGVPPADRRWP